MNEIQDKYVTYIYSFAFVFIVENNNVPTSMETAAKDANLSVGPIYQGRLCPQQ